MEIIGNAFFHRIIFFLWLEIFDGEGSKHLMSSMWIQKLMFES